MPLKSQVGAKHWNATVCFVPERARWRSGGASSVCYVVASQIGSRSLLADLVGGTTNAESARHDRRVPPIGGSRWPTVRVSRCYRDYPKNRADGADHQHTRRIGGRPIGESGADLGERDTPRRYRLGCRSFRSAAAAASLVFPAAVVLVIVLTTLAPGWTRAGRYRPANPGPNYRPIIINGKGRHGRQGRHLRNLRWRVLRGAANWTIAKEGWSKCSMVIWLIPHSRPRSLPSLNGR